MFSSRNLSFCLYGDFIFFAIYHHLRREVSKYSGIITIADYTLTSRVLSARLYAVSVPATQGEHQRERGDECGDRQQQILPVCLNPG